MKFSSLDIIVVVAYLLGIGALGIYQTKKIKSLGDYFAGGRKFKCVHDDHAPARHRHPCRRPRRRVVGAAYGRGLSGIWA